MVSGGANSEGSQEQYDVEVSKSLQSCKPPEQSEQSESERGSGSSLPLLRTAVVYEPQACLSLSVRLAGSWRLGQAGGWNGLPRA